jgi:hypothetical protein
VVGDDLLGTRNTSRSFGHFVDKVGAGSLKGGKFWPINLLVAALAIGRQSMKVEHLYVFGGALFMVLTSAAYLLLAGR